ncbi:hypothetical protein GCM10009734_71950 [Nonomuraea bangladeshensis]
MRDFKEEVRGPPRRVSHANRSGHRQNLASQADPPGHPPGGPPSGNEHACNLQVPRHPRCGKLIAAPRAHPNLSYLWQPSLYSAP